MRQIYISLIKEYLKARPDYKENLDEIKRNLLQVGARDEEISLVLEEMENKSLRKFRKVMTFGFIAQGAGLLICFIALIFYYKWMVDHVGTTFQKITQAQSIETAFKGNQNKSSEENQLLPNIYATSKEIDVRKTFSYQGSGITLPVPFAKAKKEIFGFLPYWMFSEIDKMNLGMSSTIALFGLEADSKGNIVTSGKIDTDQGWEMWNDPNVNQFIRTMKNKGKKVVLVIKAFDNDNIEKLVMSDSAQKTFIANAIYMVQSKSLDGLNLDFEYVGTPNPTIRNNFSRFINNLYIELKKQLPTTQLSLSTYVHSASDLRLFDISTLANQVDYFVIMGYDFHTPSGAPGPIAPLNGELSLVNFLASYLDKVPADKLILALPYFGYDWDVSGKSPGQTVSYGEISGSLKNQNTLWDETAQTPYYFYNAQGVKHVVHFDNTKSLGIKFDYINKKGLRGVGIWALGYDGLNSDLERLLVDKFAN